MSVFPTLITWTNGQTVTASQMNANVRDASTWLKGALDLLTNSTSADTGTTMYVQVRRTASTETAFEGQVGAEANPRFRVLASGKVGWGAGGASALDTFLDRLSAAALQLTGDSRLLVAWDDYPSNIYLGGRASGFGGDTNDRIQLGTDASGYPRLRWGNGGGTFRDIWYDPGSQLISFGSTASPFGYVSLYVTTGNYFAVSGNTAGFIGLFPMASNLNEVRFSLTDTAAVIARTATGHLKATGRWTADDGLTLKTVAGTVDDGDFTNTVESGLTGLDTTNLLNYVRVGSTWRAADLEGGVATIGPFGWTNLAASQSNLTGSFGALAEGVASTVRMAFVGSIVGLSVRGSTAITAGGATAAVFRPQIGGSNVGPTVTMESTTNPLAHYAVQAPGIDTFTATSAIGCAVTTSGTFAPTGSTEYSAVIFVVMHRW